MKRLLYLLLIFVFALTPCARAQEEEDFLSVSDGAGILSEEVERYIYTRNRLLHEETGARIIFATAEDTGELTVNEYAARLYDDLGISHIGRNNGIFVFICSQDKDYSLIVSRGINAALTDSYAQKCLVEYMEKDFDKGDYDSAVVKTFNAFGEWYVDTYDADIDFTEDMSEFKSIINTEKKQKTIRTVSLVCVVLFALVFIMWAAIRHRRNKRMEKLRRKRQERRKKYMEIKKHEV